MHDLIPIRTSLIWATRGWWFRCGARQMAALGVVLTLAPFVCAGYALMESVRRKPPALSTINDVTSTREPVTESPSQAAPLRDFTARLPGVVDSSVAFSVVQSAAQRAEVAVTSVQTQEALPTSERLGRVELSVTLRGEYAAVKQWLTEVATRLGSLTLSRMQLQRVEGTSGIEARVIITVWSQAAANAPSEPR